MSATRDKDDWEAEEKSSSSHSSRSSSTRSTSDSDRSCSTVSGSGSEQEDLKNYKRGGYHPLKPNDFLNERYLVIRKLGWGCFSTVWMAFDQSEKDFKALKVVRSARLYSETALDEIELLQHAANADPDDPHRDLIVRLHESFELDGPFGHHIVLVMEITGPSLFSVCNRAGPNGLNLHTVRNLTRRILQGLAYMHDKAQIIHTDLKPENISLAIGFDQKLQMAKEALSYKRRNIPLPKNYVSTYFLQNSDSATVLNKAGQEQEAKDISSLSDMLATDSTIGLSEANTSNKDCFSHDPAKEICDPMIKIVDLGNACWTYKKFGNNIQTREYRSFEILMGADYQANVDIWSLGCISFELATGDYLFNPRHGDDFATDEDHVAQMIERLGLPGRRVANKGKYYHKFFNRRGVFKCFHQKDMDPQSVAEVLMEEYKWKEHEARCFAQFIEACLVYDPALRPSAATLLKHPFFTAELSVDYIVSQPQSNNQAGDRAAETVQTVPKSNSSHKLRESFSCMPGELVSGKRDLHMEKATTEKAIGCDIEQDGEFSPEQFQNANPMRVCGSFFSSKL